MALYLNTFRFEDAWFVGVVFRFKDDLVARATNAFQCGLFSVNQGNDDGAIFGAVGAADNDGITVINAGLIMESPLMVRA